MHAVGWIDLEMLILEPLLRLYKDVYTYIYMYIYVYIYMYCRNIYKCL